jgi:hypothetical protein
VLKLDYNNPAKYKNKLLDIQNALTLVDTDNALIVTICKEMAFQWVPLILNDLMHLMEENRQLHAETTKLNLQNDSLLQQNIGLAQRLHRQ